VTVGQAPWLLTPPWRDEPDPCRCTARAVCALHDDTVEVLEHALVAHEAIAHRWAWDPDATERQALEHLAPGPERPRP
jgi:hypothetical protein